MTTECLMAQNDVFKIIADKNLSFRVQKDERCQSETGSRL